MHKKKVRRQHNLTYINVRSRSCCRNECRGDVSTVCASSDKVYSAWDTQTKKIRQLFPSKYRMIGRDWYASCARSVWRKKQNGSKWRCILCPQGNAPP